MRHFIASAVLILSVAFASAQLKSPSEFLGYEVGSKFTPHFRVVEYFRHVALNSASNVRLEQYGTTNEGRPLLLAFVSSVDHIRNLEGIKKNNLGLASLAGDNTASTGNAPAIVWLSYNVHGNEASSTEAAMMTLYSLVDPAETRTKDWLRNTVVIIDPCLNPDGRDRYVNWFISASGKHPNPSTDAREHREPWPGGRTNHYYFDLNRDWAWQTQIESQQRIKVYNEWLPQVHVDFHEQYIDNPYYFAPAAQPYHEVITPWQRQFQETIGRNHARYFDERGWLFFTKEYFDLLYPSYGDTYPTYNGSIGMTYEQAGHSLGGTSVQTESGDTLRLLDRATHHHTTGLSTIEISSKNAAKLVTEFREYFSSAARNGVGEYKTFLVKQNPQDADKIKTLLLLLDRNGIRYGAARQGSARGFNYNSGREETFNITDNDIIISTVQPKGAMVKVLFEPNTTVVDSNTYDITAWSLPYAYGLQAYATRTAIASSGSVRSTPISNPAVEPYGYVARWNGVSVVKLVSRLLKEGIKLRFTEQPLEIAGQSFPRGAVIVIRTSNQYVPDLWGTVRRHANETGVQLVPVSTGFVDKGVDFGSSKIRLLKNRSVALLTGEGTSANASGEIWHFFENEIEYPITLINLSDISNIDLSKYNVIIMPNGNFRFLNEKASADKLKNWVSAGGQLIALENAVAQIARSEWGIKPKKKEETGDTTQYSALRKYEDRERDFIPNQTPGSIYKVQLDNTHPLAFGYPDYYYTLKQDDALYEFIKEGGWNVGVLKKDKQVAGFVGSKLKERLKDGLLLGVQDLGNGKIIYMADNVMFRSFWENGKLMLCNAVFLVQ